MNRKIVYKDKCGITYTLNVQDREGETVVFFNNFTSTHNFTVDQYRTAVKEIIEQDGGIILEDKELNEPIRT